MNLRNTLLIVGSVFLSACEQPPDCNVLKAHVEFVTANAGCLIRKDRHMLVVKQRIGGQYNLPAGTHDSDESAQCTAHRETWEETGINIQVGKLLHVFDNGFRLYSCQPVDHIPGPGNTLKIPMQGQQEITEALWIKPEDIESSQWRYPEQLPTILRLFEKM